MELAVDMIQRAWCRLVAERRPHRLAPDTHRGVATGLRYVTGHRAADASLNLDWASLANSKTTLVVYIGASTIREIAEALMDHDLSATTPVPAVTAATTAHESYTLDTLGGIAHRMSGFTTKEPILFIIGQVAALGRQTEALRTTLKQIRNTCVDALV